MNNISNFSVKEDKLLSLVLVIGSVVNFIHIFHKYLVVDGMDKKSIEAILYAGLNDEAVTAKGMNRVTTFGICIKNETQKILGGAKGAVLYENLNLIDYRFALDQ